MGQAESRSTIDDVIAKTVEPTGVYTTESLDTIATNENPVARRCRIDLQEIMNTCSNCKRKPVMTFLVECEDCFRERNRIQSD